MRLWSPRGWPAYTWVAPQHFNQEWQRHTLPEILRQYGQPSEILLHYWRDDFAPYSIGLLYEREGFVIEYMGLTQGQRTPGHYGLDPVTLCVGPSHLTDINLWLPTPELREPVPLRDIFRDFGGGYLGLLGFQQTPTLEEATGMSMEAFYQIFQNPDAHYCLDANADLGDAYP